MDTAISTIKVNPSNYVPDVLNFVLKSCIICDLQRLTPARPHPLCAATVDVYHKGGAVTMTMTARTTLMKWIAASVLLAILNLPYDENNMVVLCFLKLISVNQRVVLLVFIVHSVTVIIFIFSFIKSKCMADSG